MQSIGRNLLGSTALTKLGRATISVVLIGTNTAQALPQNGQVVGGSASISQVSPSELDITQSSNRAVIDWQSFSIGSSETTRFIQPGASSVAVNRVTGVDPSQILGRLTANGQVVLVNPNGILFGKGAKVDVGGLVASTSGITTSNAMAGNMIFDQPGSSGATIENDGHITARNGGLVALVSPNVVNNGVIQAKLGKVSLASGDKWALDLYGDNLVSFDVTDKVAGSVTNAGMIKGGTVALTANAAAGIVSNAINMSGVIEAKGIHQDGGTIVLDAGQGGVTITGTANASGKNGGTISVSGDSIIHQGTLKADGNKGAGGTITMNAASTYIDTANAVTSAKGSTKGGSIAVSAGTSLFSSGTHKATSTRGVGGSLSMTAPTTSLVGTTIDVSGAAGGGTISVGGGPHGGSALAHATATNVTGSTTLTANATQGGNGGVITVWSDWDTTFAGVTYAKGGVTFGTGGHIEVSSAGTDHYAGISDASAPNGAAGELLLDPKTIIVDAAAALFPQFQFLNPNATLTGTFGSVTVALSTGNVVVTDPTATIGLGPLSTGAAYLFNGLTGQLISALFGTYAGDDVGSKVTPLTNGNFVVSEATWNLGKGAATFGSGTLGINGTVSATNSLVGSNIGDNVGLNITALTNGNYVVGSPNWNGGIGASSWGSGTLGLTGTVSSSNSLVGSTIGDHVGLAVAALTNGDYVVESPSWNGSKGAATWANGAIGATGTVSAGNSFVGSNAGDEVGITVTALIGGDYVVGSPNWNSTKGAATWANGNVGLTGTVSSSNSLIGSLIGDEVGLDLTALSNGDYVVGSPDWALLKGAATWGNGTGGTTGTISASNSLIGSLAGDKVGLNVTALTNGNYVVGSPNWVLLKGAATWGSGTSGVSGTISTANSLIGSTASDQVGLNITALTNGNYVVGSPLWDTTLGAATFGNGSIGIKGTISPSNSLTGSFATDEVGLSVTALSNGNYVVGSPLWNGTLGAATFGSGTTGIIGVVSTTNSLTGSHITDEVGLHVIALTNGNYVIGSPQWNLSLGAATWGSGTLGVDGTVSNSNSLTGSLVGDLVGSSVTALTGGNYVVLSVGWNGGLGAATYELGNAALSGIVTTANSITGRNILATPLMAVNSLSNGTFTVSFGYAGNGGAVYEGFTNPNQLTYAADQDGTITIAPSFITQVLNTGTSVTLQANDDIIINSPIIASASGNGGGLTLQAGRSLAINGNITTDNGNLTLIANDTAADGVINSERDAGGGVISMGLGTSLNAGTGAVSIATKNGAGITNGASGGIVLNNVSGSTISIVDQTQNNLTLNGALTASASGNSIIVSTGTITDLDGAAALNPGAGRYVLYSINPTLDTLTGLSNYTKHYGISYSLNPPSGYTIGGNYSLYSVTPTVTISANNSSRTYGSANPVLSYSAMGLIDGDTIASALSASPILSTSATSASNVGSYGITLSNTLSSTLGYNIVTSNGTLSVNPAALTITSNNASRVYGAANPALSASLSGLVNGDSSSVVTGLSLATTANGSSNIGSYAITASGALASNYTISYGPSGTLSITPAALTITPGSTSRVYGALNPTFGASYTGFVNGDSSNVVSGLTLGTSATVLSNVGTYAIVGSGASSANYYITYGANGTLSINPAALTITANNASRLYGANNPAFSATYSGLVNGDGSGVITNLLIGTSATSASNVGSYAITASNGLATNYAVTYVNGTLSVAPAALTITANNSSRVYGANNPTFSASYNGLVNNDPSAVVSNLALGSSATSASNVGSYAITGTGAFANNYNISYVNGTLSVTPAELTITANNASRIYGATNPSFSASYNGLVNSDSSSAITGLSITTSATTSSNIGSYAITASGASANNYSITYGANGTLAVIQAPLTITANNASRLYGTNNPAFSATYSGLVNNDGSGVVTNLMFSTAATSASNIGAYTIAANSGTATNYAITYVNGTLSVTPAALTITANNASHVYGAANPALGATYSGLVNNDTSGVVSGLSLTTTATSASDVGTYAIVGRNGSAGNYTIAYVNGVMSVTPAALTITANNANRLYGAANPSLNASYNGLVNGDTSAEISGLSLSTSATSASNVGNYAITATGASDGNYNITYGTNGILTVAQASLTITAQNAGRLYGANNPAFSGTYSGLVNGDGSGVITNLLLGTNATSASNVGNYAITGTNAAATNYTITYVNGTLAVSPAALTITANNSSRVYGTNNPAFSATYSGLVNGDASGVVSNLTLATTATSASNVGSYAITGTGATAQNYTIAYGPSGMLSVTPAALTITADNASRTYGTNNPIFSATYSGLVNGDTSSAITGLALSTNATSASNIGNYTIAASGASDANYTITYGTNGNLSVTPAALTIAPSNSSRVYGSANPAFSATYTGLVNGDTSSAITGLSLTTNATSASNVGSYMITGSGASDANYTITYAMPGTFLVTPAALTINTDNSSRVYGAVNPSFSATYSGLVNGDTSSAITGLSLTTSATTSSNVGLYAVTASGGNNSNYAITYGTSGMLTVTPASLTITPNSSSRLYGANNAFTASFSGLVAGDTSTSITGLTFSSTATSSSNVGTYSISAGGGNDANYTISYGASAILTVIPAPLTITPENETRLPNTIVPLSADVTGLVNGDTTNSITGLTLTSTANRSSAIGNYPIVASGANASNYTITYGPNGTLSIVSMLPATPSTPVVVSDPSDGGGVTVIERITLTNGPLKNARYNNQVDTTAMATVFPMQANQVIASTTNGYTVPYLAYDSVDTSGDQTLCLKVSLDSAGGASAGKLEDSCAAPLAIRGF